MIDEKFKQFARWYRKSPGKELLRAEKQLLGQILPTYYGAFLVQVGGLGSCQYAEASPIIHHIYLGPEADFRFFKEAVQSKVTELPFLPNSIDMVILPHVLEFCDQPQKVLSEVYHVLNPGGRVLILGFNPISLWGICKLTMHTNEQPWGGRFVHAGRVRRWLLNIGYTVTDWKRGFYRPPLTSEQRLKELLFIENVGQLCWPFLGAFYIIVAEKSAVQPIKLKSTRIVSQPVASRFL